MFSTLTYFEVEHLASIAGQLPRRQINFRLAQMINDLSPVAIRISLYYHMFCLYINVVPLSKRQVLFAYILVSSKVKVI